MTTWHKTGCTGKRVFATFCQARRAAKRMNRAHEDGHLQAYPCRYCHKFHVGEARDHGLADKRIDKGREDRIG